MLIVEDFKLVQCVEGWEHEEGQGRVEQEELECGWEEEEEETRVKKKGRTLL